MANRQEGEAHSIPKSESRLDQWLVQVLRSKRHFRSKAVDFVAMLAVSRFPISSIVAAAKVMKRCVMMKKTLKNVKYMMG
jgi:hypothetical protein